MVGEMAGGRGHLELVCRSPHHIKVCPESPNVFLLQSRDLVLQGWSGQGTMDAAVTVPLMSHEESRSHLASNQSGQP